MPRPRDLPDELWTTEQALIRLRRGTREPRPAGEDPTEQATVGLAFSGGGIRSATISLGVLQAFAKKGRLRFVDYVSTVSGGGYIGTFLGALFTRSTLGAGPAQWNHVEAKLSDSSQFPTRWLRENGRFLAPNGAGDLALAFAVVARNMLAVQVVIAALFLTVLLTVNGVRRAFTSQLEPSGAENLGDDVLSYASGLLLHEHWWVSPIMFAALACVVLWVLPVGIAYWFAPSDERNGASRGWRGVVRPALLVSLPVAAAASVRHALVSYGGPKDVVPFLLSCAFFGTALCTVLAYVLARSYAARAHGSLPGIQMRNWLTTALRNALLGTAILGGLAGIDTVGQTIYAVVSDDLGQLSAWVATAASGLIGLATMAQRVAGALSERTADRLKLPAELIAGLVGMGLLLALLVGLASIAHALTWQPREDAPPAAQASIDYRVTNADGATQYLVTRESPPAHACERGGEPILCTPEKMAPVKYGIALACMLLLTMAFSRSYSFVNRSSLAALYGARLARAYLGASNIEREDANNQSLTRVLPGDELELRDYQPHRSGGPLSIINVTVNETVGGQSQVEQRDRKGLGMAIGPAGISVGVKHHAAWKDKSSAKHDALELPCAGPLRATETPAEGFRVFPKDQEIAPRWPTMGRWMAISGAAVSTGLGSRTSLGLSLVIGLLNFRLGHWWQSGVETSKRDKQSQPSSFIPRTARWLARVLPVQAHLFNELFARFPGTATPDWYLSDGGHFENTGAYELIRRRVAFIILCDNGADPGGELDDLGNLVRKARLDFGAHIEFLTQAQLGDIAPNVLGPLVELGFGGRCASSDPHHAGHFLADDGPRRPSRYAALARISYEEGGPDSLMLVMRPSVLGHEPLDVLNYHLGDTKFPQQSTGDQFFDEAQWESYRRLGEYMACRVLEGLAAPGQHHTPAVGWTPIDPDRLKLVPRGCATAR